MRLIRSLGALIAASLDDGTLPVADLNGASSESSRGPPKVCLLSSSLIATASVLLCRFQFFLASPMLGRRMRIMMVRVKVLVVVAHRCWW